MKPLPLCSKCCVPTPEYELNADELCTVCAALESLRAAHEDSGAWHPRLKLDAEPPKAHNQLPPSDR
jgi:hypothetical protein